jgi:hypothetical protein
MLNPMGIRIAGKGKEEHMLHTEANSSRVFSNQTGARHFN